MSAWFSQAEHDIEAVFNRQVSTVYKVCYNHLRNAADAEDAAQSVFVKAIRTQARFESEEHERAWLIRVAANHCKDLLKNAERRNVALDEAPEPAEPACEHDATLEAVMSLPSKYKDAVYLYYYEGYTAVEIARLLDRNESTVRSHLSEARAILRETLGGDLS